MPCRLIVIMLAILLMPSLAIAEEGYLYTNHRLDYVKITKIPKKELAIKLPTHPAAIPVEKMRELLGSIRLSHRLVFNKEVESQSVFNERAVGFLAPYLTEAFQKVGADEQVVFSYLFKDPIVIMRNDRFTVAKAWVKGNELHVEFMKLHAKLEGDYDKRGNFDKVVNRARGLRIELETQPGQVLGASNAAELIIDMHAALATRPN